MPIRYWGHPALQALTDCTIPRQSTKIQRRGGGSSDRQLYCTLAHRSGQKKPVGPLTCISFLTSLTTYLQPGADHLRLAQPYSNTTVPHFATILTSPVEALCSGRSIVAAS